MGVGGRGEGDKLPVNGVLLAPSALGQAPAPGFVERPLPPLALRKWVTWWGHSSETIGMSRDFMGLG